MEKTTIHVDIPTNIIPNDKDGTVILPPSYSHKNIFISGAVRSKIGKKIRDELLKD